MLSERARPPSALATRVVRLEMLAVKEAATLAKQAVRRPAPMATLDAKLERRPASLAKQAARRAAMEAVATTRVLLLEHLAAVGLPPGRWLQALQRPAAASWTQACSQACCRVH